jgi:hypothetical protein
MNGESLIAANVRYNAMKFQLSFLGWYIYLHDLCPKCEQNMGRKNFMQKATDSPNGESDRSGRSQVFNCCKGVSVAI